MKMDRTQEERVPQGQVHLGALTSGPGPPGEAETHLGLQLPQDTHSAFVPTPPAFPDILQGGIS